MNSWKEFLKTTEKQGDWSSLAERYFQEEFYTVLSEIRYQDRLNFLLEYKSQKEIEYFEQEGVQYALLDEKVYQVPKMNDICKLFVDESSEYFNLLKNFISQKVRSKVIVDAYIYYINSL